MADEGIEGTGGVLHICSMFTNERITVIRKINAGTNCFKFEPLLNQRSIKVSSESKLNIRTIPNL
jgi:hypothetical protein